MQRWEKYFAQIECDNNAMSNPDLRKTLKTYKQKFLYEVEEMVSNLDFVEFSVSKWTLRFLNKIM